jgi:hypothetical protein
MNERSIFRLLTGRYRRRLSDEKPVPNTDAS